MTIHFYAFEEKLLIMKWKYPAGIKKKQTKNKETTTTNQAYYLKSFQDFVSPTLWIFQLWHSGLARLQLSDQKLKTAK